MSATPASGYPPLAPGDVQLQAHASGAISVRDAAGSVQVLTLAQALAEAERAHAAGGRVLLLQDPGPLPATVVDAIAVRGIPVVDAAGSPPLVTWGEGTDALTEAAATGALELLEDLVARGAAVDRRDRSGSTALHHAAARGNVAAIDALVAAGADVDATNRDGFTPRSIARAARQEQAVARLVELGADDDGSVGGVGPTSFSRVHGGSMWYWALLPVPMLVTAVVLLWPLSWVDLLVVGGVGAAYLWALPPRAYWAGGVPRALVGDRLLLRALGGRKRTIDLRDATAAALGGAGRQRTYGGRTLLLDHPAGHPVDARALSRLGILPDELDIVAERIQRAVVISISGAKREEVLLAVGNRLSALGVDLSPNLRRQLAQARADRRQR